MTAPHGSRTSRLSTERSEAGLARADLLRRGAPIGILALATTLVMVIFWGASGSSAVLAGQPPVGLGTARSFGVLAGTTVTNTGPSLISGNVGVSPGTAITGFPPGQIINGTKHAADAVALQAQNDLTTAYNDAAGRTPATSVSGDIGGQTLGPGVYKAEGPLGLTGTVTLDGQGRTDAVFIFQVGSTLITSSSSTVALIRGAQGCNVFWQVGSSATLGASTNFVGTIMALTSASLLTGARVSGRVLARNGAVTLDTNTITRPSCLVKPPPTTTPPTTIPTTTPPTTIPTTTPPTTIPTTTPPTTIPTTTPPTTIPTTTPPTTTSPGGGGTTTSPGGGGGIPSGHPETGLGGAYRSDSSPLAPIGALALLGGGVAAFMAVRRPRPAADTGRSHTDANES
ncbi:MAG: ice-binding family protein [Nocardioidaceae bacterium]